MSNYKAAVIGVGKPNQPFQKGGGHAIGHTHAGMFQRNASVELIAGGDINADNLKFFQEKFGVPQGFLDYREMLQVVKPDLVSIGTYVGLHRQIIEDCARAGVKGVVCEKPFLNAPADVEPVRKIVSETGLKVCVAHQRRYYPVMARTQQFIRDGVIGKVICYMTGVEGWDLSEMASHWFDLIRMFHGDAPVKWVFGQARVGKLRGYGHAMEDHAVAYFEFADGARAIVDGGRGLPNGINFVITGTAGTIRVLGEGSVVIDTIAGQRVENVPAKWNDAWDATLAGLIKWIEGGRAPVVAMDNALQTMEVNHAAYISALRGDRVDLPLDAAALAINEYPVELLARRVQ
jgi:predicted dehydrogenase